MTVIHFPKEKSAPRIPMEHRWGVRVPVDHPVAFGESDSPAGTGRLIDASISGALIATDARFGALTPLTVRIRATIGGRETTLPLAACVVRSEPGAVAVEWRDMATPALVELLQHAQADAQLWARDTAFG